MIRLGLCCQFHQHPICFRQTTAAHLQKVERPQQLQRLSELCLQNAQSLLTSLHLCTDMGIRAFRIITPLFPRYTHPDVGYELEELPQAAEIRQVLEQVRRQAQQQDIRLSFHPDQFVLLNSPREEVVRKSLQELNYQAMLAEWVGAEVINLHAGGAYNDKPAALQRLRQAIEALPDAVRRRLTLENDDCLYTPSDLLPVCHDLQVPLVYDVHHHRCLPDGLSIAAATDACEATWQGREPWCHISSPRQGYTTGGNPRPHADRIRLRDWPAEWQGRTLTVDVEAKEKEVALIALRRALNRRDA